MSRYTVHTVTCPKCMDTCIGTYYTLTILYNFYNYDYHFSYKIY